VCIQLLLPHIVDQSYVIAHGVINEQRTRLAASLGDYQVVEGEVLFIGMYI
jgi:hypothetical protein